MTRIISLILMLTMIYTVASAAPFENKDSINVVYFGGSITQGSGASAPSKSWVGLVGEYLKSSLAPVKVNNINTGMGGTGSDMGLFRLNRDVISKKPDLVFVEFAVNDHSADRNETIKNMEAIVRNLQKLDNPPNIIFIYTTSKDFDSCVDVHEEVAKYYGIPSINLQEYIQKSGVSTDEILKDGVHPNDKGYQMYADYIIKNLATNNFYKQPKKQEKKLIESGYDFIPRFDPANNASATGSWTKTAAGLTTDEVGAALTYDFSGTMLAIQNRISSYGGKCSIEIDGAQQTTLSMYYNVNDQPVMWYKNMGLSDGKHTLKITVLQDKDEKSQGNRIAMDYFIIADGKTETAAQPQENPVSAPPALTQDGIIYDTAYKAFAQTGTWTTSNLVGYNGQSISMSDEEGAEASWDVSIKNGIYKMYVWSCLSDKGTPNGKIKVSCTTLTETKDLNFQRGVTGWKEVGIYNITDGRALVSVTGQGGRIMVSALKFVPENENYRILAELFKKVPGAIVLKTDSRNAFINGVSAEIPDVAPVVEQGRTLLPLRFVAEATGARIDWNDAEQSAVITSKDTVLIFKPDNAVYTVNGEEKQLDVAPAIRDGRMLLPLRAVAENIGKQVFWDDSGLIVIADEVYLDNEVDREMIQEVAQAMTESD